ncbi:MAG: hydrogenase nickel incorporation protein HypB [Hydrogenothermaceae bacterium]
MCKDCGCSITHHHEEGNHHHHHNHFNPALEDKKTVEVLTKILDVNDRQAQSNREHFEEHNILSINLMSSPGAGKTTLLEKTIELLNGKLKIGVIEGDLETNRDAERIKAKGVPAYQITTGQACHLDAFMVHDGIHHLPLDNLDIVFIENVGNLVCPASYDVGAHINVVLLSVPEGSDKVAKYPVMFSVADLVLITKTDLLPYFDFNIENVRKDLRKLNPKADIILLSTKSGEGMDKWLKYILFKKEMME